MTPNNKNKQTTLEYYQSNAEAYFLDTAWVDPGELYKPFLELMPETGVILDAGCGSGRDARFFMKQGFKVIAFDNSSQMVKLASDFTGLNCLHLSFENIEFENKFDGIWACASLLHVRKKNMLNILKKFCAALKNRGIMYISYKYGNREYSREGRHFSDYDEQCFSELLKEITSFNLKKMWKTKDLRPGHENEKWLNILLEKKQDIRHPFFRQKRF